MQNDFEKQLCEIRISDLLTTRRFVLEFRAFSEEFARKEPGAGVKVRTHLSPSF